MEEDPWKSIVKALPKWVISALALSIVIYVFSLSGVAVLTERDVRFWPPEIGPGPKNHIISEVSEIKNDIKGSLAELNRTLVFLQDQLAKTRAKTAESQETLTSIQWAENARAFERDIDNFDSRYEEKVALLLKKVSDLELKLKHNKLIY
jgi:hypothetical protein